MKLFTKILVPVDFSSTSLAGMQRALQTAVLCKSREIHLISVVDINTTGYFVTADTCLPIDYQVFTDQLKLASANLEKWKSECQLPEGTELISNVLEGSFSELIPSYVKDHDIDLVVMGTAGTGGIQEFIFGSHAQEIASHSPCPVLTLQPHTRQDTIRKMIIPVENFYPANKLNYAAALAALFQAEIHLVCLRMQWSKKDLVTQSILQEIKKELTAAEISYRIFVSDGSNITDAILRYAEKEMIDLILVNPGAESKLTGKFIQTTGGNIINHTQVPVLTVRKSSQDPAQHQ
ncbi:MAG: universal stress protein [Bacteroidota bacterium]|nr:universal stress protein [Bacteroidota bacterium]